MTTPQMIGAALLYLGFGYGSWKLLMLLPDEDDILARIEAGEEFGRKEKDAYWMSKLLYLLFWPLFLFLRVINMVRGGK